MRYQFLHYGAPSSEAKLAVLVNISNNKLLKINNIRPVSKANIFDQQLSSYHPIAQRND